MLKKNVILLLTSTMAIGAFVCLSHRSNDERVKTPR